MSAGSAANAIPDDGIAEGTVRCLDDEAWHAAPDLLKALIDSVASAYGVVAEISYQRNVPPTVNEVASVQMLTDAVEQMLGNNAASPAPQSLGGEDFAWYLESIPGAFARLGTRSPGLADDLDLHQGTFDVDERAIDIGVKVMAAAALRALGGRRLGPPPTRPASHAAPASQSTGTGHHDAHHHGGDPPGADLLGADHRAGLTTALG